MWPGKFKCHIVKSTIIFLYCCGFDSFGNQKEKGRAVVDPLLQKCCQSQAQVYRVLRITPFSIKTSTENINFLVLVALVLLME